MLNRIHNLPKSIQYLLGIFLSTIFSLLASILFFVYHVFRSDTSDWNTFYVSYALFFILHSIGYVLIIRILGKQLKKKTDQIEHDKAILIDAEKEKMRANLLRAVSHDLRTPLTGIIGNSLAYLENSALLTSDEKDSLVMNIREDSSWLLNMVENLLSVTRINSSDLSITKTDESVEEVIGEAIQKIQKRHPNAKIYADFPAEFILLPMDAMLIEQVIINLVENSIYHSHSEEPIELIVENHAFDVSITIRDHGTGIPDDMLSHLFDGNDYTASSSDVMKGMGIGLVICKTIITAHDGIISGRNHEDGAEFSFTLPKGGI